MKKFQHLGYKYHFIEFLIQMHRASWKTIDFIINLLVVIDEVNSALLTVGFVGLEIVKVVGFRCSSQMNAFSCPCPSFI